MYFALIYLLIKFVFMYFKRFLIVAILTFMAPVIGISYAIDKIKDNKSQSLGNWLKEYTFNVLIQSVHALLYVLFVGLAFNISGDAINGAIIALLLINFIFKAEVIFKKIFGIQSKSLKDALKSTAALVAGYGVAKKLIKTNVKAVGIVAKPITSSVKDISARTKQYKRSDKVEKTKKAIEEARQKGIKTVAVGKYNFNIDELINDEKTFSSQDLANKLVSKAEQTDKAKKEKTKELITDTLSAIGGGIQVAAAIPIGAVDEKAGLMMAASGRRRFKNSFSVDEEKEKKYTGKRGMLKDFATGGIYGKVKTFKGKSSDYDKELNKSIKNAQYEIAMKKLEKKINKQTKALGQTVDYEELEKVLRSANLNASSEDVQEILYLVQAYRTIEIKTRVSFDIENVETAQKVQQAAVGAVTIQEICRNLQENNVCTYKSDSSVETTSNEDSVVEIEEEKLKRSLEKELSKVILATKQKEKRKDITKEDMDRALRDMDDDSKAKLIGKAIKGSTDKNAMISIEDQVKEIAKETKDIDKMYKKIKKLNKDKKVEVDEGKFKKELEKLLKGKISKEEDKRRKDVTDKEMKDMFKEMDKEEREEMIQEAMYRSIEINEEVKKEMKKEKSEMGLEDVETIIEKMKKEIDSKIEQDNYKENFESIIRENIEKEWEMRGEDIDSHHVDEYIAELTNEQLVDAIRLAGADRTSFRRDKLSQKEEYKDLVDNIERLNYYKAKMKG